MTTVVHTADVHLRPDADARLDALEAVLSVAEEQRADVVTIGGDLFDRPEDVDALRGTLRNSVFADRPFEVLLIPGNHDVAAFRGDLFFGDSCTVVADVETFGSWVSPAGDLRIVCVPYREVADDDLLLALGERDPFDGTDVLLFHGSLDAPIGGDAGGESAYRYFPVSEAELTALGFDYYLAGHYHGPHHLRFESDAEFAYPGTPAATRTAETGQRRVVHLDPDDGLSFTPLATAHYLQKRVTVTPGDEAAALADLESWVETAVGPEAVPSITVEGVLGQSEAAFAERLHAVADPEWVTNETVSVEHVRSHSVLQEVAERLDDRDWDEEVTRAVWTRTLQAAGRVAPSGRLD